MAKYANQTRIPLPQPGCLVWLIPYIPSLLHTSTGCGTFFPRNAFSKHIGKMQGLKNPARWFKSITPAERQFAFRFLEINPRRMFSNNTNIRSLRISDHAPVNVFQGGASAPTLQESKCQDANRSTGSKAPIQQPVAPHPGAIRFWRRF